MVDTGGSLSNTMSIPTPSLLACLHLRLKKGILRTSLVAQWLKSACQYGEHRLDPWSGKIPHAAEQLSPCATSTEPASQNY